MDGVVPRLADLYGIDLNRLGGSPPEYTSVMERPLTDFEREQRSAPIDRPYASGQLEAPMVAPDDLIGSGIPTKLAALAAGVIRHVGSFVNPLQVKRAVNSVVDPHSADPVDNWLRARLSKYLAKTGGTENDELVSIARERNIPIVGINPYRGETTADLMERATDSLYSPARTAVEKTVNSLAAPQYFPHRGLQALATPEERLGKLYSIFARSVNRNIAPGESPWSTEVALSDLPNLVQRVIDESAWGEGVSEATKSVAQSRANSLLAQYEHLMSGREGPYVGPQFRINMGSRISADSLPYAPLVRRGGVQGSKTNAFRLSNEAWRDYGQGLEAIRRSQLKGTPENFLKSAHEYPDQTYNLELAPYEVVRGVLTHLRDLAHIDQVQPDRMNLNAMSFKQGADRLLTRDADDIGRAAELLSQEKEALRKNQLAKYADPNTPGASVALQTQDGWRADRITNASRLTKECELANATWCTKNESTARSYLRRGEVYVIRSPEGVPRAQVFLPSSGNAPIQIRNRTQSGPIKGDQGRQAVIELLKAKGWSDEKIKRLGNVGD